MIPDGLIWISWNKKDNWLHLSDWSISAELKDTSTAESIPETSPKATWFSNDDFSLAATWEFPNSSPTGRAHI
ncbi:hypothetical protein AXF42_Ash020759 [Apostasia shenzhenica]|uniref:Uncharacterized protein n=1 Tax=Apostasia shenzhenica TaxID=1088818 RepID=A0A2I0APR5_9ASPA|nr:hypothetical protein AXF42_Ash020759 [Apostasia shenzhenica]